MVDRVYPLRPLWVVGVTMIVVAALASIWHVRNTTDPIAILTGAAELTLRRWALPGLFVVVALIIAARAAHRWQRPVRRLRRALADVRNDRAATGEIEVGPLATAEMKYLADEVRWLAVELKKARGQIRELESEMRHKLADRDDVFERKIDALRHKASRDTLSGLSNRAAFEEVYPAMVEAARAKADHLCVVMIDLDNFKQVNDQLGHDAGDRFITEIGRIIKGAVREHDEAFRYGGDEFVLVLSNTTGPAGTATADRLSRLVDDLAKGLNIEPSPGLSWGLASLSDYPTADAEVLLKTADKDCYRRKQERKAPRYAA
ncbi:MAG: GGDEF domain-containing protein [Planctomycetota bacterium]